MSSRPKIAFLFNFITHYRVSFFEKLCAHQEYEWLIFHGLKNKQDGRPAFKGQLGFPNQSSKYLETTIGPFHLSWQQGLSKQLISWNPDVIITLGIPGMLTNWAALVWAHRRGKKTITWYCGWEVQSGNPFTLPLKRYLLKRYFSLVDTILVYSSKGLASLTSLQPILAEKTVVCYNGLEIDPLLSHEADIRAQARSLRSQQVAKKQKVFLYVGGISADKRVDLLLQALHKVPDKEKVVLWIVGDGPDLSEIKKEAGSLQLENVTFWGRVVEGVDVLFAAADYFILPGVGGLALNQALFWEVPCIVSEADGTERDLVFESRTGYYFSSNDSNSLAEVIQRCLALPEDQKLAMGQSGRKGVIERSNVNQMVKTFLSSIGDLTRDINPTFPEGKP